MKKGSLVILFLVVIAAIYFIGIKPSSTQPNAPLATNTPTSSPTVKPETATPKVTSAPITEAPVSKGSYRDEYNAIAKYQMSELESNTRKFRMTAEAGGCYIEFNNYRDTTGYYEIVINAKSSKKEDAPVFIQICQDMITSIAPSISKDKLNTITNSIKDEKGLEDYSINEDVTVTYHRPISWSSGYISIKIQ